MEEVDEPDELSRRVLGIIGAYGRGTALEVERPAAEAAPEAVAGDGVDERRAEIAAEPPVRRTA